MDTNNKNQSNTWVVYSMRVATELIKRGHIVVATIPNAKDPKYTSWIFAIDQTFERDLEELKGGARNGK